MPNLLRSRHLVITGLLVAGSMNMVCGLDSAPTPAPAPAPTPVAATDPPMSDAAIDDLLNDALRGNDRALASLRTAVPQISQEASMAILERVRAGGASRHSGIAAVFISHNEAWVQRTAITTITKLGVDGPETVSTLVKALQSHSPMVAQAAAAALSSLRDARSWSPLIELLNAPDANLVRIAHDSLKLQTSQTLPAAKSAWDEWLKALQRDEKVMFAHFQAALNQDSGDPVAAVDGLAGLALLRDEATAVLITLVDHPNPTVRAHVERHLRQWTGTLGNETLSVAVERAQVYAAAPPPAPPPTNAATATNSTQAMPDKAAAGPGFLESTTGLISIITAACGGLALLLWFLRTPAGKLAQNATLAFTKRIGRSRVVVMVSNGTKRIARSMPKPIRVISERISSPAKQVASKLAEETQRMLNPNKPR